MQDIQLGCTNTSANLVSVEIQESRIGLPNSSKYVGKIVCPLCLKETPVPYSHATRENCVGKGWWNTSGFDQHLKEVHKTFSLDEYCKCDVFYKVEVFIYVVSITRFNILVSNYCSPISSLC